jgi:hypothetical protein
VISIIDEIKDRVSMNDILEMYGIYPVRGKNIYRCPFHHPDRKPSAGVHSSGKYFKCYTENKCWGIFDFVQEYEQCDLKTAMKIIDEKFNLGLLRELSHREKLELARQRKERERKKAEELEWQRFEEQTLRHILLWTRFYEGCESAFAIKKGQYRGAWSNEYGGVYFYVLKQLRWLEWLYSAICGTLHEECEYDFVYPSGKRELLEMIKSGAISI